MMDGLEMRDDSTSSLGDWYPNEEKLKGTLKELAEKINAKGLKFGALD